MVRVNILEKKLYANNQFEIYNWFNLVWTYLSRFYLHKQVLNSIMVQSTTSTQGSRQKRYFYYNKDIVHILIYDAGF